MRHASNLDLVGLNGGTGRGRCVIAGNCLFVCCFACEQNSGKTVGSIWTKLGQGIALCTQVLETISFEVIVIANVNRYLENLWMDFNKILWAAIC